MRELILPPTRHRTGGRDPAPHLGNIVQLTLSMETLGNWPKEQECEILGPASHLPYGGVGKIEKPPPLQACGWWENHPCKRYGPASHQLQHSAEWSLHLVLATVDVGKQAQGQESRKNG